MKNKFLYIGAVALLLGASGCDKFGDFGNTNADPNAVAKPIPTSLLAGAMNGVRGQAFQQTPGYYIQYFAETQYPEASLYRVTQSAFSGAYSGAMYDLVNITTLPDATNNQKAVARLLLQYQYWNITDQVGDIPYSEAMKGVEFTSPKYDTQEEIYRGMLAELSAVASSFDNSLIPGDIMYNGNVAKWKKLNNSLRMLMAVQLSKKFPGAADYAATQFKAALADAGGSIETNADNWTIAIAQNYQNGYWAAYNGRRDLGVTDTYVNMLLARGDQRLKAHAGSSELAGSTGSSEKGVPFGRNREYVTVWTDANPTWAKVLRGDLREERSIYYMLTAGPVLLVRSEAANLGWTTENAAALYARGIEQSHLQWGRTSAEAATYLANPLVAFGTDNAKKIAEQQYIAYFPDALRAWNVWRKTGFPVLASAADYISETNEIPQRYIYADSEGTSNKEGFDAAVAKLPGGTQKMTHKLWWAQ